MYYDPQGGGCCVFLHWTIRRCGLQSDGSYMHALQGILADAKSRATCTKCFSSQRVFSYTGVRMPVQARDTLSLIGQPIVQCILPLCSSSNTSGCDYATLLRSKK